MDTFTETTKYKLTLTLILLELIYIICVQVGLSEKEDEGFLALSFFVFSNVLSLLKSVAFLL